MTIAFARRILLLMAVNPRELGLPSIDEIFPPGSENLPLVKNRKARRVFKLMDEDEISFNPGPEERFPLQERIVFDSASLDSRPH